MAPVRADLTTSGRRGFIIGADDVATTQRPWAKSIADPIPQAAPVVRSIRVMPSLRSGKQISGKNHASATGRLKRRPIHMRYYR